MKLKYILICAIVSLTCNVGISQTRNGGDYAVIFTTYKYENPAIWPNLNSVPGEVAGIEQLLRDEYGFKVKMVDNASRKDIERTMEEYNQSKLYGSDSQLLLFFSMHGQRSLQGEGYLIPKEGTDKSGTWLAISQLRDMVDELPCPHILVSLDACYSGTFAETKGIPTGAIWEIENLDCYKKKELVFENKAPTRKYLTAGRAEQRVPAQSLFSKRWEYALNSRGGEDGILSFLELCGYVCQFDERALASNGVFGKDRLGDFAFISKNGCNSIDSLGNDMVFIEGGAFQMGCTSEQKDCNGSEKPVHRVTVSDFYLARVEVTQKFWKQVMGNNPAYFNDCNECPVENVSWDDAQVFINKLNVKNPGKPYRLPTEAEWEFAARGGKLSNPNLTYPGSSLVEEVAWCYGNSDGKTHPIAKKKANVLGLYDMSGNVYEWCEDWYNNYTSETQMNPIGPNSGRTRVCRGGSWSASPIYCRIANRYSFAQDGHSRGIGFRLARSK